MQLEEAQAAATIRTASIHGRDMFIHQMPQIVDRHIFVSSFAVIGPGVVNSSTGTLVGSMAGLL